MGTSEIGFTLNAYQLVTPLLFSAVVFFLLRVLKKFDQVSDKSVVLTSDLLVLKDRLSNLDRLSDKLQMARDDVNQMKEQIAVLKRDQESIWRRLDETRESCNGRHST